MRRSVRRPAALAVAALLGAACARAPHPVEVPQASVPFELSRTPGPAPSDRLGRFLTVYFVRGTRLEAVTRPAPAEPPLARAAMEALLSGPSEFERSQGVQTDIPAQARILEIRVVDTVAEVDLSDEFQGPAPPEVIVLRVAQVVWTLVALPQITSVQFLIDGAPVSVPTDQGSSVQRPVSSPDYELVAPA